MSFPNLKHGGLVRHRITHRITPPAENLPGSRSPVFPVVSALSHGHPDPDCPRSLLSLAATSTGYLMTLSSSPRIGARSAFTAAPARSVFRPSREALRSHKPPYSTDCRAS